MLVLKLNTMLAISLASGPVDGKFTPPQRAIYELVLAAQMAAIDEIRPGASFDAPHEAAVRVIQQGLIELGLISQTVDGAPNIDGYKRFFMHRTGPLVGTGCA
jgi:aminopeptidase P (EC:3.4.11.9). Metallo peptidase. MEROPS family M24B